MIRQKILCVDDNPDNLITLEAILGGTDAEIIKAEGGEEALKILEAAEISLAILDIQMPGMDGYELALKLKQSELTKNIPLIFLSAVYSDNANKLTGYASGAVDFITKPFDPFILESKVKIFLQLDRMRKDLLEKIEVEKSKNYLESIINSTNEGIIAIDFECTVILTNTSAIKLWDYTSNNFRGINASALIEDGIFKSWLQEIRNFPDVQDIDKLFVDSTEITFCKMDGNTGSAIMNCSPLLDSNNIVQGGVISVTDLTESRSLERALDEYKEKLKYISTYAHDAILMINQKGNISFWNPAATKIFGYEETEVLERDLHKLLVPELYFDKFRQGFDHFLKTGEGNAINKTLELSAKRKSGEVFPIELSLSSIKIKGNWNAIGIIRDITTRKKAENELRRAKEQAEENNRLKAAFIHNISHEIRTPMNAIVGFSAMLSEDDQSEESRQEFTKCIIESTNQLLDIITDIVEISNIEAKIVQPVFTPINPLAFLEKLLTKYSEIITNNRVKFKISSSQEREAIVIVTDASLLQKIMDNLISNAFKFSSEGEIEAGFLNSTDQASFYVKDTGIGISKEFQSRIFEPFYQVENSFSRTYGGTGLGLTITKAYIELLGGKLKFKSIPGQGSEFSFTLPYIMKGEELTHLKSGEVSRSAIKSKTILVAEDDDNNYNLIVNYLTGLNVNLLRASNGEEAIDICKSERIIDVILMDIRMPLINGYEATRQIKKIRPSLRIIAQTAYADDRKLVRECGCSAYISKPFDKDQLVEVLMLNESAIY